PFVQAEASTTRRYGGSGLGLAISKHIIELMGGEIWVESDLGHGATFCFTVQLATADKEEAAAMASEHKSPETYEEFPSYAGKRIILAEDININQEIVLAALEPMGITIDVASNGSEALTLFEAAPEAYDLIFMDVQMPIMDGHEATRKIRAMPFAQAQRIPIIAMTANVFAEDISKCHESGMNSHLGKPLNFEDMMATLKQYFTP
ncbi:MAG: response regulator, partial [Defluviitaleaceae bacterium]|nr:response regulator [Defluviitaleaceae bacterium]